MLFVLDVLKQKVFGVLREKKGFPRLRFSPVGLMKEIRCGSFEYADAAHYSALLCTGVQALGMLMDDILMLLKACSIITDDILAPVKPIDVTSIRGKASRLTFAAMISATYFWVWAMSLDWKLALRYLCRR